MKKITLLIALLGVLSIQAVSAQNQEVNSDQVIVRIFETGGFNPSMILVAYGDDKVETIDIKNSGKTKNWIHNLNIIHKVLDRVRNQGYSIVNSTAVGGDAFLTTTYIFLRNDLMTGPKGEG